MALPVGRWASRYSNRPPPLPPRLSTMEYCAATYPDEWENFIAWLKAGPNAGSRGGGGGLPIGIPPYPR